MRSLPLRAICANCPILWHCTKFRTFAARPLSHGNNGVFSRGAVGTSIANPVSVNDDCRPFGLPGPLLAVALGSSRLA